VVLAFLVATATSACSGDGGSAGSAEVHVAGAWARSTTPETAAVYFYAHNSGPETDRLIGVTSAVAGRAELLETVVADGTEEVRAVEAVEIPPGDDVSFEPGGYQVVLLELAEPLAGDTTIDLTLSFERAGEVPVSVVVRAPESTTGLWGTPVEPASVVAPFTLTDQFGERFDFPKDTGAPAVTLLYMGYTHCPDICPDTMAEIAVALRGVAPEVAEQVEVVFVTVDPARDDPARLREWIGVFDEGFTALTGAPEQIERIVEGFGYEPGKVVDLGGGEYTVGHPVEYLAIAPDGTVRLVYPWDTTVAQLQEDLTTLVEEGWES
jgi:protein SCO1/2